MPGRYLGSTQVHVSPAKPTRPSWNSVPTVCLSGSVMSGWITPASHTSFIQRRKSRNPSVTSKNMISPLAGSR